MSCNNTSVVSTGGNANFQSLMTELQQMNSDACANDAMMNAGGKKRSKTKKKSVKKKSNKKSMKKKKNKKMRKNKKSLKKK